LSNTCNGLEEKYKQASQISAVLQQECEGLRAQASMLNDQLIITKQEFFNFKQAYETEKMLSQIHSQQELTQKQSILSSIESLTNRLESTQVFLSNKQIEWETRTELLQKERNSLAIQTLQLQQSLKAMLDELEALESKCTAMAKVLQDRKDRASNKDENDDAAIEVVKLKKEKEKLQSHYEDTIRKLKQENDFVKNKLEVATSQKTELDTKINDLQTKIAINKEKDIMKKLAKEYIKKRLNDMKAHFGFTFEKHNNGISVQNVSKGGAAESGGIEVGDLVDKLDNIEIKTNQDLKDKLLSYRVGQNVNFSIKRKGKPIILNVEAGSSVISQPVFHKIKKIIEVDSPDDFKDPDMFTFFMNK